MQAFAGWRYFTVAVHAFSYLLLPFNDYRITFSVIIIYECVWIIVRQYKADAVVVTAVHCGSNSSLVVSPIIRICWASELSGTRVIRPFGWLWLAFLKLVFPAYPLWVQRKFARKHAASLGCFDIQLLAG